MTVETTRRALSTLSPVPDVLKTPSSMVPSAENSRMHETRTEAEKALRAKVTYLLNKDRAAIREVRLKTERAWSAVGLEPDVLEQKLANAALDKLMQRRTAGQDVGAVYSAFKDYVPPVVYGNSARGDREKQRLIELQLEMSCGGSRRRRQRDVESDDEEPNPCLKKEEEGEEDDPAVANSALRGISREISSTKRNTSAQRDLSGIGKSEQVSSAASKQRSSKTRMQQLSSAPSPEENDDYNSESGDSTDLDSASEAEQDSYSDGESEEESPNTPLIAVLRGQPLPEDLIPPVPLREMVRRQRLAAIQRRQYLVKNADTGLGLQAVLRGQIDKNPGDDTDVERVWVAKKGFVSRKRVRETEGVEGRGQEGKKVKKAK